MPHGAPPPGPNHAAAPAPASSAPAPAAKPPAAPTKGEPPLAPTGWTANPASYQPAYPGYPYGVQPVMWSNPAWGMQQAYPMWNNPAYWSQMGR
jgi:hypothetical protein